MNKTKFIAGIVTLSVLTLLLMLGPAEAFILGLTISEKSATIGDLVTLTVSAEIEESEIIPIDSFILELNGKENAACKFDTNGTIIEGCKGITIEKISMPEFGYGYGFKPGTFIFEITLDTSLYQIGKYDTKLIAVTPTKNIEISGDKFFINAAVKGVCSIRAENGLLEVNDEDFLNNRLSFMVPLKKASNGQGFLIGQDKKDRFSYKFQVLNVIENNNQTISLLTSGTYKINHQKGKTSDAIITVNKKAKTASVVDKAFESNNMNVGFIKGC